MRPKLLEIEGLQSFKGSQKIDFDSLGETGLFGIFGPTGSGKSTVLDAITFALYGRVKRADRGTQGIINSNLNTAKVAFTFELQRDGERKTYRVERTYQRKKGSVNSCEPRVARLIEITAVGDIPICDKASEVSGSIEELLGLSHDDFTRAVVLPQNSFQEFLMLDNTKKRDMLERIFYLEEYGKQLLDKLGKKMSTMKSRIDVLSGELSGYADASAEAIENAEKAMNAAILERNRVEKEYKLLDAKHSEAKEVWLLVQDLLLYNKEEEQHEALKTDFNEKRRLLDKAVKADSLLGMINKNRELSSKLNETQKQLDAVLGDLPAAVAALEDMSRKHESLKNEIEREQPGLVGMRARLVDALGIKAEIQAVQAKISELQEAAAKQQNLFSQKTNKADRGVAELAELEQSLARLVQESKLLVVDHVYRQQIQEGVRQERELAVLEGNRRDQEQKIKAIDEMVTTLQLRLVSIRESIADSQKTLQGINAEKQQFPVPLPEERNTVMREREQALSIRTVCNVLKLKKAEIHEFDNKLSGQSIQIVQLQGKLLECDAARDKAQKNFEQSRLELDRLNAEMHSNAAHMFAKSLKDGSPCPVCGSMEHPDPASGGNEIEQELLENQHVLAEKNLAAAESSHKQAEMAVLTVGEQLKALITMNNQTEIDLDSRKTGYEAEVQKLPENMRAMTLEQLDTELEKLAKETLQKLEALGTREKQQEVCRDRLQMVNDKLSEDMLLENGIMTELKMTRENRAQSDKALSDTNSALTEIRSTYTVFLGSFKLESATAELEKLSEKDHRASQLQKQIEKAGESAEIKKKLLEQLKAELVSLNQESIKTQADIDNAISQKNEKEKNLAQLVGTAAVEDEIRRIDERLEGYSKLEKEYGQNLQSLQKRNNELQTGKSMLENQKSIYSESLKKDESLLEASMKEKGFTIKEEAENSVIPGARQKELKDAIDEYDQKGLNIKAQKNVTLKKIGSRSITEDEWNRIDNAWRELAVYKEECVSGGEVAKSSYNALKIKHDRWLELDRAYNQVICEYGLLEQIQKLLRADRGKDNSFIDYIAEERLRYVAAKASETLGQMTKYKYALELDTDAGFIIRDNANGGVLRMVSSLSGGETFLTSLSLALALSEQIQLKGQSPLEFFFLDEGFGTLDNELLDTVIDSLERLSRKDRVIGLISHVPELRNRLARRLVVEPPSLIGDGSRVRIEKA